MKYLSVLFILAALSTNAATGYRKDDVLLYGGGIVLLGLIIGAIYLSSFIKRKIREFK